MPLKKSEVRMPVRGRYSLLHKLAKGSFGVVYLGRDLKTGGDVAVKMEKRLHRNRSTLRREARIYKWLTDSTTFPTIHWTGEWKGTNIMVMELLGPSLKDVQLVPAPEGGKPTRFSQVTISKVCYHVINGLEYLHSKNFLHQDIKPNNMVFSHGDVGSRVKLVDLGIAKKYRHRTTGKHIPYAEGKKLVGTVPYASINNHLGIELSRRDDLESLALVALFFLRGSLPWHGMKKVSGKTRREKWMDIQKLKLGYTPQRLFEGYAPIFANFMAYVWNIPFDATPNYAFCRKLFAEYVENSDSPYSHTMEILDDEIPENAREMFDSWKKRSYHTGETDSEASISGSYEYEYYSDSGGEKKSESP